MVIKNPVHCTADEINVFNAISKVLSIISTAVIMLLIINVFFKKVRKNDFRSPEKQVYFSPN